MQSLAQYNINNLLAAVSPSQNQFVGVVAPDEQTLKLVTFDS